MLLLLVVVVVVVLVLVLVVVVVSVYGCSMWLWEAVVVRERGRQPHSLSCIGVTLPSLVCSLVQPRRPARPHSLINSQH